MHGRWRVSDESVPDQALPGDESVGEDFAAAQGPTRSDERRLADLIAGNQRTEGMLKAKGVTLKQDAVVALQVRALLRLFVGNDPAGRMAWDLAYQEEVALGLAEIAADLAKRNHAPRLLIPGAPIPNVNGR